MFRIGSLDELAVHLRQHQTLSLAHIEDVTLSGTLPSDVTGASFLRCRFAEGAVMPSEAGETLFVDCRMVGMKFQNAHLFGARFVGCDLSHARFVGCDMAATEFVDCTMDGMVTEQCDLDASSLPDHRETDEAFTAVA